MQHFVGCLLVVAIVGLSGCNAVSNPQAETAAVAAATNWLALVDGERYSESWDEASTLFQGGVPQEKWIQTMQSFRRPFGRNLSRELKIKRYRTALPGAPDGEYVVIQFKASFEHKKSALETITPMLESNGTWRVSGYFMK